MSIEPNLSILDRNFSIDNCKEILSNLTPLLQTLVNYGSNVLLNCASSDKIEGYSYLAPLALYRNILEYTDSFEVLISNSCVSPTIPIIRSCFESQLSLEYILENDSTFDERSMSWIVNYFRSKKHRYLSYDPHTSEGLDLRKKIEDDPIQMREIITNIGDLGEEIAFYNSILEKNEFKSISDEFKNHKRSVKWYSLFNGPTNLENLAKHLKKSSQYQIMYRLWSLKVHGNDFNLLNKSNVPINRIRKCEEINYLSQIVYSIFVTSTRQLMIKFNLLEDFDRTFTESIRPLYIKIFG